MSRMNSLTEASRSTLPRQFRSEHGGLRLDPGYLAEERELNRVGRRQGPLDTHEGEVSLYDGFLAEEREFDQVIRRQRGVRRGRGFLAEERELNQVGRRQAPLAAPEEFQTEEYV